MKTPLPKEKIAFLHSLFSNFVTENKKVCNNEVENFETLCHPLLLVACLVYAEFGLIVSPNHVPDHPWAAAYFQRHRRQPSRPRTYSLEV